VTRLLLIVALLLALAWAFWRVMDGIIEAFGGLPRGRQKSGGKLVRDPVCGTWIPPHQSLGLRVEDTTHYFCSDKCRDHFRKLHR
jgi:YHS domain-containing protein